MVQELGKQNLYNTFILPYRYFSKDLFFIKSHPLTFILFIRNNNTIYSVNRHHHPVSMIKMLGFMFITINTVWNALAYLYTKCFHLRVSKKKTKKKTKHRKKKYIKPKMFLCKHLNQIISWINILQLTNQDHMYSA